MSEEENKNATQAEETVKETPQEKEPVEEVSGKEATKRKLRSELDKANKKLAETEKELEKLRGEYEDTVRLLQRNQADFENFRRRNKNTSAESFDNGKRAVMADMLPALDDFERVLANPGTDAAALTEGMNLVYKKYLAALTKLGLEALPEEGKFDPALHNAVMSEKAEGVEPETILAVFQKGYKVGDKIIRCSMVKVSE